MLLKLSIKRRVHYIIHTPAVDKGEILMCSFENLVLKIHQEASDSFFPIIWYAYP